MACLYLTPSSTFAQSGNNNAIDPVNFYYPQNVYKFKVSNSIKDYIKELKQFMDSNSDFKIKLDGYAQDGKVEAWNTRVSKYRVRAVRDLFIDFGIQRDRIEIEYFGRTNHISKDNSSGELAKNRRVEVRLLEQS